MRIFLSKHPRSDERTEYASGRTAKERSIRSGRQLRFPLKMAKIVLATIGSLGDMHPKIALAIELKERGHAVTIAAMEFYRERIEPLGIGFAPMAPHLDPNDGELARDLMDARKG